MIHNKTPFSSRTVTSPHLRIHKYDARRLILRERNKKKENKGRKGTRSILRKKEEVCCWYRAGSFTKVRVRAEAESKVKGLGRGYLTS